MKPEEIQKQTGENGSRIDPLDIKLADLDARIEKNKAALERTNAELEAKLTALGKRLISNR